MKFSANLSILFPELAFTDRAAAAHAAGFDAVECWWPFTDPTPDPAPSSARITAFVDTLDRAGVRLTGLNFYAGDMPAGDRGILSHPDATDAFDANLVVVREIAERTGCRHFNALYGQRLPGVDPDLQDLTAVRNLTRAAENLADIGGVILLEPLSSGENGDYPLATPDDACAVIDRVGSPAVRLLFDAYHLTNNGVDVVAAVTELAPRIGHIQIADSPGRGQPGTGTIDYDGFFTAVEATGYDGVVGCEYRPHGPTVESFDWMTKRS
ncbi:hydroxypyruvate isomerase [Mycetocola sp. CAN_C7]|uniref:hydroxypyruvate isomerase family protein n=1 Tax=Mycetocola sp. CAN_C7 TaxID=2787724 RepID=UPI0018CAD112